MRKGQGWLAVLAMATGMAGAGDAAVRGRTVVKAKVRHKAALRRTAAAPVRLAIAPLAPAPLPLPFPAVETRFAAYRWLDDADSMMQTVGGRPDFTFGDRRSAVFGWQLGDGALVVMEPVPGQPPRAYFYAADMTAPFLVRDGQASYGFDRGVLDAVYDAEWRLIDWQPGDWRAGAAADLYARGRQLWFAARTPRPVAARGVTINLVAEFGGWRDNDGWRAYRGRHSGEREGWRGRDRRRDDREVTRTGPGRGETPEVGRTWPGAEARDAAERPTAERQGWRTRASVPIAQAEPVARRERRRDPNGGDAPGTAEAIHVLPTPLTPVAFAPAREGASEPGRPRRARGDDAPAPAVVGEPAVLADLAPPAAEPAPRPARPERDWRTRPAEIAPERVAVPAAEPPPAAPPQRAVVAEAPPPAPAAPEPRPAPTLPRQQDGEAAPSVSE